MIPPSSDAYSLSHTSSSAVYSTIFSHGSISDSWYLVQDLSYFVVSALLCWQDFNWHDASRGPSAIAELLVPLVVGLGWVGQMIGWVGSGHTKWTHGQLWRKSSLHTPRFATTNRSQLKHTLFCAAVCILCNNKSRRIGRRAENVRWPPSWIIRPWWPHYRQKRKTGHTDRRTDRHKKDAWRFTLWQLTLFFGIFRARVSAVSYCLCVLSTYSLLICRK